MGDFGGGCKKMILPFRNQRNSSVDERKELRTTRPELVLEGEVLLGTRLPCFR